MTKIFSMAQITSCKKFQLLNTEKCLNSRLGVIHCVQLQRNRNQSAENILMVLLTTYILAWETISILISISSPLSASYLANLSENCKILAWLSSWVHIYSYTMSYRLFLAIGRRHLNGCYHVQIEYYRQSVWYILIHRFAVVMKSLNWCMDRFR